MKKILSALGIIVICLCSCNNNITNPEVDEPNNEKSNCLLNISADGFNSDLLYLILNSLTIKDENGKVVGIGAYWGSYYVPYDGTLTINWKHRGSTNDDFVNSGYTFNVKSAHQLDVVVDNDHYNCRILVGGSVVASFGH